MEYLLKSRMQKIQNFCFSGSKIVQELFEREFDKWRLLSSVELICFIKRYLEIESFMTQSLLTLFSRWNLLHIYVA